MSEHIQREEIDDTLKLFVVMSRALRAIMDQSAKHFNDYKLNHTEFAVMELLYHKGAQPLQQIGGKILLASGSITYVVDKLEQKGLLYRQSCEKDRRVTYATITETGIALMDEIFPQHEQNMYQLFNGLSAEEKKEAIMLMKKLGLYAKQYKE